AFQFNVIIPWRNESREQGDGEDLNWAEPARPQTRLSPDEPAIGRLKVGLIGLVVTSSLQIQLKPDGLRVACLNQRLFHPWRENEGCLSGWRIDFLGPLFWVPGCFLFQHQPAAPLYLQVQGKFSGAPLFFFGLRAKPILQAELAPQVSH